MADYPSLKEPGGKAIVYVRAVNVEDLPAKVREQADGMAEIYAVSDVNGQMIALVDDRERAFMLARMHEFRPVSVH